MSKENIDHDTWVYHALKDAKIVKASEAKLLYKKGWRDSPDPKVLYKGVRGKWYWLILAFKNLIRKPNDLTFTQFIGTIGSIASIASVIGLVVALLTFFI